MTFSSLSFLKSETLDMLDSIDDLGRQHRVFVGIYYGFNYRVNVRSF